MCPHRTQPSHETSLSVNPGLYFPNSGAGGRGVLKPLCCTGGHARARRASGGRTRVHGRLRLRKRGADGRSDSVRGLMVSDGEYRLAPTEVHNWNVAVEVNNRSFDSHQSGIGGNETGRVPLKADESGDRPRADRRTPPGR